MVPIGNISYLLIEDYGDPALAICIYVVIESLPLPSSHPLVTDEGPEAQNGDVAPPVCIARKW